MKTTIGKLDLEVLVYIFFILSFLIDPISGISWKIAFAISLIIINSERINKYFFLGLVACITPFLLSILRYFFYQSEIQFFELKFVIFYCIIYTLSISRLIKSSLYLNWSLAFLCSFFSIALFIHYLDLYDFFYENRFKFFSSPNSLGFYSTLAFIVLLLKKTKMKMRDCISLIILTLVITLSDSRNAYGSCLVIILIHSVINSKKEIYLKNLAILLLFLTIPISFNALSIYSSRLDVLKYFGIRITLTNPQTILSKGYTDEELTRRIYNGRKTIWVVALDIIKENPLVGIGKRNFSDFYNENIKRKMQYYIKNAGISSDEIPYNITVRDPHNLALGLMVDYGIPFSIFIIIIYLVSFGICFIFKLDLYYFLLAFFLNGITNYHIYRPVPEVFLILSILVIINLVNKLNIERRRITSSF